MMVERGSLKTGAFGVGAIGKARVTRPEPVRARQAENALADIHPFWSARPLSNRAVWARCVALAGALTLIAPGLVVTLVLWSVTFGFVALLAFRAGLALVGRKADAAPALAASTDTPLPDYTVLVALKNEAASMPQLARALCGLDYPAERLDVKLLLEAGDDATIAAIEREVWPAGTQVHVLPPGAPRTKPRALNYGLATARGSFVVIYDAEDRPHPQQLRAALAAFAGGPPQLACVQAPLVGKSSRANWISAHWALEYAIQFGSVLPALARLQAPIMLGGTSNHFRRRALEEAGGWDAWNVTEDADLGLRFARLGLPVGVIRPPTYEAPPETFGVWLAQRSRWLKGFLQTWCVLMRDPLQAWRELGAAKFLAVQLTLGGAILSALVHGPWALWCLFCGLSPDVTLGLFGTVFTALAYGVHGLIALFAGGPKGWARLGLVLTLPQYWPLQSLAMARAVYGLFSAPQYWAKTPHGADRDRI